MEKKRILDIDGSIDHSLSSLEELIEDLEEVYLSNTTKAIEELSKLKKETIESYKRLEDADEIIEYIEYCIKVLQSVEYDLKRLLIEIPESLEERHLDILTQIHERCYYECENQALEFKIEHIEKSLKDESLRPLLDEIYSVSRGAFYGNVFLGRLKKRLQTFVGSISAKDGKSIYTKKREPKKPTSITPFPAPPGTSWSEIKILFLSNVAVDITVKDKHEGRQYTEIGFMDNRGYKYGVLWFILAALGKYGREISLDTPGLPNKVRNNLKSNIYRLRKTLRQLFKIEEGDPIEYDFKRHHWRANFIIRLANEEIYDDVRDDFLA